MMSLTISQKLMLAFLGLTLIILTATLGLARWSFERGFLDYVNALEQTRLERISQLLSDDYLAAGQQWQNINPQQLKRRLTQNQNPPGSRPPPPDLRRPPPPGHDRKPPPDSRRPAPPGKARGPGAGPPPSGPPTALLDATGQHLAGVRFDINHEQIIRIPIVVNQEQVGELLSLPRRQFDTPLETAFSRQQLITSLLIGLASLAVALLVAWLLTRILLKPVQTMVRGIRQLSQGNYALRLQPKQQDELGQLANDINHLALTLEENQHSRRRWIADISHELRTPVTILTGEIAAIQEGIRPFSRPQLDSLASEVTRLNHLIDDLYQLSLSDMGGLRYEFAAIDITENLQRVTGTLQRTEQASGINISINNRQPSHWIEADSQRIDQLLTNLIKNSLAYTDKPGSLVLDLYAEGGHIILQAQDSAPGVSDDEYTRLFEPLYRRDDSRNRRTAGAGLGLAICKNIVQAHRGTIEAAASELGGLCIRITLPELKASPL